MIKHSIVISQTGCLLPLFIILNLLFGWLFLSLPHWLAIEALLITLFLVKSLVSAKKFVSMYAQRNKAIDVEGRVIQPDKGKLD